MDARNAAGPALTRRPIAGSMRLRARKLGREAKADRLDLRRADGSAECVDLPRQGILPHDLVHYVVEQALPGLAGFLSLVAAGARPAFAMEESDAQDAGAGQVEALVEALQAQLWQGTFDAAGFLYGMRSASAARGLDPAEVDATLGGQLFRAAVDLAGRWNALGPGETLELDFHPDGGRNPSAHPSTP